jgi:N-acetylneuraminic acid mutarotase
VERGSSDGHCTLPLGVCAIAGELYDAERNSLAGVEKFTPERNTWSAVSPLPTARSAHAAVVVGSAMYVLGGTLISRAPTASVLRFDSAQGAWSEFFRTIDIYVFGECNGGRSVFGTETNDWSQLAHMPRLSFNHSVSVLDGMIDIVGANSNHEGFDPALGAFSTLVPTSTIRQSGTSFVIGGCLYVVGERDENASSVDVATNT